jgi:hypothetical protein
MKREGEMGANGDKESKEKLARIFTPRDDDEYYGWLTQNMRGFVLNVRHRKVMLHHATCLHIKSYRIYGAMTRGKSRKHCAESRDELIRWVRNNPQLQIRTCGTCAA